MCFYARKVDIHGTYANSMPCARKHPSSRTFPSRTLTFETVRNRFEIMENPHEFKKSRNETRCHHITCVACDKNLRKFRTWRHIGCLETHTSLLARSSNRDVWVSKHLTWRRARNFLNFLPQTTHVISSHFTKFHDFLNLFEFFII